MRFARILLLLPALLCAQDAREIVRRAVDQDRKTTDAVRLNYTFLQRDETHELDAQGKIKTTDIKTWDVTPQEGSPYRRLVARNDKPLTADEQQFEQDRLQKSIQQRRAETPEQRERRIAEWRRKQEKQREPVKELPDAFDFQLAGSETLNGAEVWVIDATPRPGFKPKSQAASIFPKMKGRLWIDKKDHQWAKVELESLDTISFGAFLVRIAKGGRITLEQTRVNGEVWLPKRVHMRAFARIALIKGIRREVEMTFSDYRKFQADSRIVSTGGER